MIRAARDRRRARDRLGGSRRAERTRIGLFEGGTVEGRLEPGQPEAREPERRGEAYSYMVQFQARPAGVGAAWQGCTGSRRVAIAKLKLNSDHDARTLYKGTAGCKKLSCNHWLIPIAGYCPFKFFLWTVEYKPTLRLHCWQLLFEVA
jgi:hypothetical protein